LRRTIASAFVGALALAGCGPRSVSNDPQAPRTVRDEPPQPSTISAALEREVFELVNRHRGTRGLPPLTLDARISRQARLHSVAMAKAAVSAGHAGFDDRVQALRRAMPVRHVAENVAVNRGYRDAASGAVRGWLRSPGHRENIEGPYQETGVGVASDAAGRFFFTQIFVGG